MSLTDIQLAAMAYIESQQPPGDRWVVTIDVKRDGEGFVSDMGVVWPVPTHEEALRATLDNHKEESE